MEVGTRVKVLEDTELEGIIEELLTDDPVGFNCVIKLSKKSMNHLQRYLPDVVQAKYKYKFEELQEIE